MGQPDSDGEYNISVDGTCRVGQVAPWRVGRHGEFQQTMGNLELSYSDSTNSPVFEGEFTKLFEGCVIW